MEPGGNVAVTNERGDIHAVHRHESPPDDRERARQGGGQALHQSIVEAVALVARRSGTARSRRAPHAICGTYCSLRPQSWISPSEAAGGSSLSQHRGVSPHVIAHGPIDHLAAEPVGDGGAIQPALDRRDIGDVSQPEPVWSCGGEVERDQVRSDREIVTSYVGADRRLRP